MELFASVDVRQDSKHASAYLYKCKTPTNPKSIKLVPVYQYLFSLRNCETKIAYGSSEVYL